MGTITPTPPAPDAFNFQEMADNKDYIVLAQTLHEAWKQSARGKGSERHGNGQPFTEQPLFKITSLMGIGFPAGQAAKKTQEAQTFFLNGKPDAAKAELLGAIVYLAALYIFIDEAENDKR